MPDTVSSDLQVVRCFEDDDIVHVSGKVSLLATQQAAGLALGLSQHKLCCLTAIMPHAAGSFQYHQPNLVAQPVLPNDQHGWTMPLRVDTMQAWQHCRCTAAA